MMLQNGACSRRRPASSQVWSNDQPDTTGSPFFLQSCHSTSWEIGCRTGRTLDCASYGPIVLADTFSRGEMRLVTDSLVPFVARMALGLLLALLVAGVCYVMALGLVISFWERTPIVIDMTAITASGGGRLPGMGRPGRPQVSDPPRRNGRGPGRAGWRFGRSAVRQDRVHSGGHAGDSRALWDHKRRACSWQRRPNGTWGDQG